MSQMLKSSGAMAGATLTSRILGMVREMVYAAFMGNSWVADAFFMAFTIPNLFRRLLGEGALTAAFIPIFKHKEVHQGDQEMWRSANAVISGMVVATSAVTVLAVAGISLLLAFDLFTPQTRLMLDLLRLMFPYVILVCLAAVFIGMANARGHFFVPALGAAALNVVMIASVLFLAPLMGPNRTQQVFGLAIGVLVAGLAQAFFQLPTLSREGYEYRWVPPWRDPTVREVVQKMLPGSIGVAAFQINVLLTYCFSFWFGTSIVSTFNYSVRLMELPQGMFGISLATYLLPTLSGLAAKKQIPEFRQTLRDGLGHLAFANLIAAAIALALAEPIVRLLFERGAFTSSATHRVALALACLAPGLLMFSMNNILARAFYALNDIKTPMKISLFCLVLNLVLAFWMVPHMPNVGLGGEVGLAAANTLSASCNVALLIFALNRKLGRLEWASLRRILRVLIINALLAGALAAGLSWLWETHLGAHSLTLKLGAVFVPGGIACALYLAVAYWLNIPAARELIHMLGQKLRPVSP
jgi:putative peptidoglycan lipid II flippase